MDAKQIINELQFRYKNYSGLDRNRLFDQISRESENVNLNTILNIFSNQYGNFVTLNDLTILYLDRFSDIWQALYDPTNSSQVNMIPDFWEKGFFWKGKISGIPFRMYVNYSKVTAVIEFWEKSIDDILSVLSDLMDNSENKNV